MKKEREKMTLEANFRGLLIIDVISGQMTNPVPAKLKENYVKVVCVPTNMAYIFQPIGLTVNG